MWAGAKRYKKFPLFNTWASLLDQSSQQLPILLLTAFFTTAVAGQYSMGYKILRLPIALIGASISQVFYQRASKAHHEQNLPQIVKNTSHQLIVFGLFPMLLLTISGRELFVLFLGAQWADAGIYSQILSIWTFFVLISAPMATLFSVLEKNEFHLIFAIVIFITRAISLVIGGLLNNIILAMVLYSITGSLGYIYMQLKLNSMVGIPVRYVAWQIFRNILFSVPFLGVIVAVKLLTDLNILYVSITSFVIALVYYLALYFYDQSVKDIVTSILTQTKLQQLFKNWKKAD